MTRRRLWNSPLSSTVVMGSSCQKGILRSERPQESDWEETKVRPFHSRRMNYVRPQSRYARCGLGYDRYEVLWRYQQQMKFKRIEARANELILNRRLLWETDPEVFYRSPFIPRPRVAPDSFLPGRRRCGSACPCR